MLQLLREQVLEANLELVEETWSCTRLVSPRLRMGQIHHATPNTRLKVLVGE
jgi:hypothetical protein